jgi:hypothetical protein
VFSSYYEFRTIDKVYKSSDSKRITLQTACLLLRYYNENINSKTGHYLLWRVVNGDVRQVGIAYTHFSYNLCELSVTGRLLCECKGILQQDNNMLLSKSKFNSFVKKNRILDMNLRI